MIKEKEDKATTIEVIGIEEPKEAIDMVINISQGNMLRILTSHLSSSLLERIQQSTAKDGPIDWNKDSWSFPQIEASERMGKASNTCLVTSELLLENSSQV